MTDFLKALLTSPVGLPWLLLSAACAILLVLSCALAYIVAVIHAHAAKSWRELLVSTTRVRISWIWGWSVSCFTLLAYVSTLAYVDRLASWVAGLPYLITAALTLAIATWLRHSVRKKVILMQKLIQGGRA